MDYPINSIGFFISDKKIKDKKIVKSNLIFQFEGVIENSNCDIDSPIKGYIEALNFNEPIQSIELLLIRKEGWNEKKKKNVMETEVLNIQIADGDIPLGVKIPIFLVLPRLYSSLSFTLDDFSVYPNTD